jgi:predicted PurR-regulated permease PerM
MWLLINGQPWHALGLLAWGCLLIHPADNLIRPLMISSAVRVPFLLVMFGVFGGIAAFGLIGLFLGPIILAVALAAWNEWVRSVGAMSDSAGQ